MKRVILFCVVLTALVGAGCKTMRNEHRSFLATNAAVSADLPTITGTVKKVISKNGVHFVKLKTHDKTVWAAVLSKKPRKKKKITLAVHLTKDNYYSKLVDKNFATLIFASPLTP